MTKSSYHVGVRRFELPAPRPPDVYSNLAELHPEQLCRQNYGRIRYFASFDSNRLLDC